MSKENEGYGSTLNLPATDFPMRAGLPKREPDFLTFWKEKGIYQKKLKAHAGHKKFILHDGPPYANGKIHLGHALNKILKDIILTCHFVWDNGHKTGHSTVISMTSSGVIFFLISFCPGSHPPRIALPEMGSTVSLIALSIYADIIHSRSGYVNHLGKEKISSVPDPAAPWLHRAGCLQQRRR